MEYVVDKNLARASKFRDHFEDFKNQNKNFLTEELWERASRNGSNQLAVGLAVCSYFYVARWKIFKREYLKTCFGI